uniref:lactoperoxidase-like n=1 Tax=Styela clava TaxID=7725 RepID=UPI00193A18AE|nr:lactoperoxidase-like [Styela clava]
MRSFLKSQVVLPNLNAFIILHIDINFWKVFAIIRLIKNRGRAGRGFKRLLPPSYGDKKGTPRLDKNGQELHSARKISLNLNFAEQRKSLNVSHFMPWWGQFITHDTQRTPKTRKANGATYDCECLTEDKRGCVNIPVESDDVRFTKNADTCLKLDRSAVVPDPECDSSIREQENGVSSYLDASNVYGDKQSDLDQLLNQHSKIGKLLVGNYIGEGGEAGLPFQSQVHRDFAARMRCEVVVHKPNDKPCMLAGDTRANENTGLSAHHVVFLRLHNKIIEELSEINPHWDKNTLIQETKAILASVLQLITFKEFLPVVIGEKHMDRFNLNILEKGYWHGYDASVDATMSTAFSAAAFRFGHTAITKEMSRPAPDWRTPEASPLPVKDIFFNNEPLLEEFHGGVNSVLRGMAKDASQLTGTKMISAMREFLFAMPGEPGHDLFATNIQRGRDHGVPGYNHFRELCGLKKASSFDELVEIPFESRSRLSKLYKHVDDIDLYVGGLAETLYPGASVGPTYACILGYQFRDMRSGDKFWFENGGLFASFTPKQLDAIRKYSLAKLMCDTMADLRNIQPRPMLLSSAPGNQRKYCQEYQKLDLKAWKESPSGESESESSTEHDTDWSPWIPCEMEGVEISVSTAFNDALKFRPDEVCRDVISTETRKINGITQVRFECARGSIKKTDYPFIDSGYEVYWTPWRDESNPDRQSGDDIEAEPDKEECKRPLAIQAQTTKEVPAGETGDVFESFGTTHGLVCRGDHQTSKICNDYRVRYLCRRASIKKKAFTLKSPSTSSSSSSSTKRRNTNKNPNDLVWTPWTNIDTPTIEGDKELLINVQSREGFCRNPLYMEARTVATKIAAKRTGDILDQFSNKVGLICINNKQPLKSCNDYEVRYLCRSGDVNSGPSVPPSIDAQTKQFCKIYGVCC